MLNINCTVSPDLLVRLKDLAQYQCWTELENGEYDYDFSPEVISKGSYDSCYYGGYNDGLTKLAREILESLNTSGKLTLY
ncbi:hypothetical protein [Caudoviricetes sp.]|nr:hypothetical protein [Caudoviricetes sp.]